MQKVGCVIGAVVILLLAVGGGIAYLRGFAPDLPSFIPGQQTSDEATRTVTESAVTETAPETRAVTSLDWRSVGPVSLPRGWQWGGRSSKLVRHRIGHRRLVGKFIE